MPAPALLVQLVHPNLMLEEPMDRLAGSVVLMWGWQRRFTAFGAGVLAALGLAPVDFFAGGFAAFTILVWLVDGAAARGGRLARLVPVFSAGWWFGFGYFLAGHWWVGAAAELPAWAAVPAAIGVAAFLALFHGLATLLARPLWSDGLGRIAALAFAFGVMEWLRGTLPAALGWNALGLLAMPIPLAMQSVQLAGVAGVGALAVFVFGSPALLAGGAWARTGLGIAAALVAAHLAYGWARTATPLPAEPSLAVRIVQAGADLESHLSLSAAPPAEGASAPRLVLWPQRALPFVPVERPELLGTLADAIGEGQMLIAGTLRREAGTTGGEGRLHDAMVAIDAQGHIVAASDRVRATPPLARRLWPRAARAPAGGGTRLLLPASGDLLALALIGDETTLAGLATGHGADIVVATADLSAYARTSAPYQFVRQAQMRAVEAGLPLLLATSVGISAAIDARGSVLAGLRPSTRGVLDSSLPLTRAPLIQGVEKAPAVARTLLFITMLVGIALLLRIWRRPN